MGAPQPVKSAAGGPLGTVADMATWYSADLHFGHVNISRYSGRPYDDVEAMNVDILDRFAERVSPEDTLVLLGDVAMGRLDDTVPLLGLLPGRRILVPGNHDKCWRGRGEKAARHHALYAAVFDEIWHDPDPVTLNGQRALLHHFPFRGSGDPNFPERYAEHRPVDRGEWLIHGHVHEKWRQRGRMINVGVDAWGGYPVSSEELAELIDAGPRDLPRLAWDGTTPTA